MDVISWPQYLRTHVITISTALLLAILGFWLARVIRNHLLNYFSKSKRNQTLILFLINALYSLVLVVAAIMVLGRLGVPTASLITILGTSSLAIGLALKDFLANIAAGVILVFQRPFDVGDLVDISGTFGTVTAIDLFHVSIKTPSNELVIIPNGKLIKEKMINKAFHGTRRIECKVLIDYQADLNLAKSIIQSLCRDDKRIHQDPKPLVAVCDLADSGVMLTVRVWVYRSDYNPVLFSLLENIKLQFDAYDIKIPYPHFELTFNKEARAVESEFI